ncbi:MAG TPA: hypothetical protein VK186_22535 [Candidatus Deferrimicrobium sp.]|nr:hypothetical protein [Candidatus Kapabacteria bacterium]HLP61635.1 hypothetical protein [Candidatus Deferrimicrobium sp.]
MTENPAVQSGDDGYDFVITLIQFLEDTFNIHFFITPKDFDVLYRWYEKRIPLHIIKESITAVVERWSRKNKKIAGFSNFYYQVKKDFESFLHLQVGAENQNTSPDFLTGDIVQEYGYEYRAWGNFFKNFPTDLAVLKEDFEIIFQQVKNKEKIEPAPVYDKLVALFIGDETLNLKVAIFSRNLAPELRKPEIENRYRLNFLRSKYNIPDFED